MKLGDTFIAADAANARLLAAAPDLFHALKTLVGRAGWYMQGDRPLAEAIVAAQKAIQRATGEQK